MYLLKRTISPYTGSDLLLGCFREFEQAREARSYYIQQYKSSTKDDPWKGQAFHDVDLDQDVAILSNVPEFDISPNANAVFVVSSFREGFGQTAREFHAICGSEESVKNKIVQVRKEISGQWPSSFSTQKVIIDKLLSDARDRTDFSASAKTIDGFKKKKEFHAAEKYLFDLIENAKIQSKFDGLGVLDWYYSELAQIYHQQKNYSKEIAVLEECMKDLVETGVMYKILAERLDKARGLLLQNR